jgi:hypothetical protein
MTCRAKILSLLVIAALAWTTSAIDAWADDTGAHNAHQRAVPVSATPNERPVGCHTHGRASIPVPRDGDSPARVPSNYKCCMTGHDAAIVQSLHSQGPSADGSWLAPQVQLAPAAAAVGPAQASTILCADPPNITALRI